MRNDNKCPKIPYSAMLNKMKSDPESARRSGSPPKVNHF